jgi:two-component system sensor histidine kinase FlrB
MPGQATDRAVDLSDAFRVFTEASRDLSTRFSILESEVARLTAELARTRDERARVAAENARLADRIGRLLDALPAGVVVIAGDGRVSLANPVACELLGGEIEGAAWRDVIARAFAPRPDDGHDVTLASGRIVNIATRPLPAESGQIVLLTDLSETRRLQETIARSRRLSAMGEMLATLAHQIRTPISSALLSIGNLVNSHADAPARERAVTRIGDRLRHLERLVTDMLGLARGGGPRADRVVVSDLVAAVVANAEPLAARANLHFAWHDNAAGLVIVANAEALTGALMNLIENAIQVSPADASIEFESRANAPDEVTFAVRDQGGGIAAPDRARIFEPFFTTRAGGTGLGLAVVRAVAQAHGGTAWVEPNIPHGSAFGLTLPTVLPELNP